MVMVMVMALCAVVTIVTSVCRFVAAVCQSSHSYEIVTERCGSLDASSRPDRRKVTVTGDVTR